MSKLFNSGTRTRVKKNAFDLSHERKLSCNMGQIIPIYLQEIVPGDKFKVSTESLVRLAPMLAPMMHRVNIHTHFFFVPNRLVYDKWQDFITGGSSGTLAPTFPKIEIKNGNKAQFAKGTLADYFGITPVDTSKTLTASSYVSALPFRAYQMIYQEYFRDQTLMVPSTPYFEKSETVTDVEAASISNIRNRCWEKDYFTSAMPWAQRGPEVMIPSGSGASADPWAPSRAYVATGTTTAGLTPGQLVPPNETPQTRLITNDTVLASTQNYNTFWHIGEGTSATAGSINDLRKASRLQDWFEKNARAGARYVEQIMAHFGVRSSDARLQRPEFLGGGINPVVISEVLSTVGTVDLPQGNMSGHGISVGHDNNFTKFFEEHGYVIGVMSVLPRTSYQQGIPRTFLKNDRYDFYWPEFANIGEQPVLDSELYHDYASATPANGSVFGYQSRFAEYKFQPNQVSGEFRDTMNYWHMGRLFASKPYLNNVFVNADPTHRVFAVTDPAEHKLYIQVYNKVTAIRPMPQFGIPQL